MNAAQCHLLLRSLPVAPLLVVLLGSPAWAQGNIGPEISDDAGVALGEVFLMAPSLGGILINLSTIAVGERSGAAGTAIGGIWGTFCVLGAVSAWAYDRPELGTLNATVAVVDIGLAAWAALEPASEIRAAPLLERGIRDEPVYNLILELGF